jgi:hypothetical protein
MPHDFSLDLSLIPKLKDFVEFELSRALGPTFELNALKKAFDQVCNCFSV